MPVERARARGVEHDDLAAGRRGAVGVGRRLAVEPQVGGGLLDQAVRLARDDEGVLGQADVERLAAAPQREEQLVGRGRGLRARCATDPSSSATVARNASSTVGAARPMRRATSAGMTLASVVISAGTCRLLERLEVGVVVDVAVERADDVGTRRRASSSSWFSGCAFASEMMPTLAQRV